MCLAQCYFLGLLIKLDPNTANTQFILSEEERKVTWVRHYQPYPDHPDRFDRYNPQLLCRESVCGRCYWEIEWSGDNVLISVSYKSISRKGEGDECVFGNNDQSWRLICSPSRYSFRHNKIETDLPVESISSRIGVYVEHSAGTLYFSVLFVVLWLPSHHPSGCCTLVVVEERPPPHHCKALWVYSNTQ